MAKKQGKASVPSADLESRANKALHEGRSQTALDLAKQAYKQEPTPSRKNLLRQAYLLRAKQMRLQGHFQDVASLLQHAIPLGEDDPGWLNQVAEELAAVGNLRGAQELLARLPAPALSPILARAVDASMLLGPQARSQLPENLHETYDLVVNTFAQLEAGQDDLARTSLQGIGLQSPFLEWKLLLRGLLAYYQKDDARALENWQRLDPSRVPARMIAPLRFRIDPAFRKEQSVAMQSSLQHLGKQLFGRDLSSSLKQIQANLGVPDYLPKAFEQAAQLLPTLKQEAPHLVARFAACFYWAIVHHGEHDDLRWYRSVFGPPPDDPRFDRLEALVYENMGDFTLAHQHWLNFERWLASSPPAWSGPNPEHLRHARALIWCRMGENATRVPDKAPPMFEFLQDHPAFPKKLSPGPEACFANALELVPDLLEARVSLFDWLVDNDQEDEALRIGQELLQRHPDHMPTLIALGNLHYRRRNYDDALRMHEQAYKVNPLEASLRDSLRNFHVAKGRAYAETKDIERARAEFQTGLALGNSEQLTIVYCKWAAAEFFAGDRQTAEEQLQRALAECQHPLPVAYYMVTEVARYKLKGSLKTRFDKELAAALAAPRSPKAITAVLDMALALRAAEVSYHGGQTHEKKLLAYLGSIPPQEFGEDLLVDVARTVLGLQATKPLQTLLKFGTRKFPLNPWFLYLEAESYLSLGPDKCPMGKTSALLERAEQLAHAMHPAPGRDGLIKSIQNRKQLLAISNPDFLGMLESHFGDFFDSFDGPDDDENGDNIDDLGGFFVPPQPRRRRKQHKGR